MFDSEGDLEFDFLEDGHSYRRSLSILRQHFVLARQQSQPGLSLVLDSVVQENGIPALMLVEGVGPDLAMGTLKQLPPLYTATMLVKAECAASLARVVAAGG